MIKSNSDGSKWIDFKNGLLLFKTYSPTKFYFPNAGAAKGFNGFVNCRFKIYKGYKDKLLWNIKIPFFYWQRDNNSWCFGNNTIYFWWHTARVK